eukprot:1610723-Rhodomonas_salina.1
MHTRGTVRARGVPGYPGTAVLRSTDDTQPGRPHRPAGRFHHNTARERRLGPPAAFNQAPPLTPHAGSARAEDTSGAPEARLTKALRVCLACGRPRRVRLAIHVASSKRPQSPRTNVSSLAVGRSSPAGGLSAPQAWRHSPPCLLSVLSQGRGTLSRSRLYA